MAQLHTADFLPAFDGLIPAFPAHSLTRKRKVVTEGGAWLVEHQEAQHRRFHSFLLYDQDYIHDREQEEHELRGEKILDGYFLLHCAKLDDPQDICSIDISNQGLTGAKEDDFDLFTNLFHVNAAEKELQLESLAAFPNLREIQMQFNSLSRAKITPHQFKHLDTLDLSYNQVSHTTILNIGLIEKLRVLILTANELKSLPSNMAYPASDSDGVVHKRFGNLEELYLDSNHLCDLSTFATLGALKKLKYLNFAKNHIYYIPHLRILGSAVTEIHTDKVTLKPSSHKSVSVKEDRSTPGSKTQTPDQKNWSSADMVEFGLTKSKITPKPNTGSKKSKTPVTAPISIPQPEHAVQLQEPQSTSEDQAQESELEPQSEPQEQAVDRLESRETPAHGVPFQYKDEPAVVGHVSSSSALPCGSIKSGMMDRENKAESPDAINKNKINVEAYLVSEGGGTDAETTYQTAPMPPQVPFPQLQTLILSDNAITEEEGVLACALWPHLCQLVLYGNPVITQCRGLPVLLTHELTLRNGISVIRTPPKKQAKPPSVTVSASTRRIKEPPRPLPRQPHPELLALEAGPPVRATPALTDTPRTPRTPRTPATPRTKPEPDHGDKPEEGFFFTQVDDQAEESSEESSSCPSSPDIISVTASTPAIVADKYKGFEDLIDVEDDPEDYIPEHIQAAVSSLRQALERSLILPDIYRPICKEAKLPKKYSYKSCKGQRNVPKGKKIDKDKPVVEGLALMKKQVLTEEGELNSFITAENKKIKREGTRLLNQIQDKYNKVRGECLQQRSTLLEEIKGNQQALTSSYSLDPIAPSLSILPRTRTQQSGQIESDSSDSDY